MVCVSTHYGNCPDVATLSDKIDDGPAALAPLKVVKTKFGKFSSAETATEQDRNDRSVALALDGFGIGSLPQGPRIGSG
jgi:hypothetical protein